MEKYEPETPSGIADIPALLEFVLRENRRIALALAGALPEEVDFLTAAPKKLREGLIVGADGTHWNPGAGKGVYVYYSGTWHLLG